MSDNNKSESNISQKIDSSSSEVKDIKFVRSSNAFEVALEYQKQFILKEYEMNELLAKFEKAKEIGKQEVIEEYEELLKTIESKNLQKARRNAFIAGFCLALFIWFLLSFGG